MAAANHLDENFRCSICQEVLLDPRPLPCGHSYCGPPRTCLVTMENGDVSITCAICRSDFNLRAADIKPLYGIRELFNGTEQSLQTGKLGGIGCGKHSGMQCNLWCIECKVNVCDLCFQDDHDEHPVRNLRKHLIQKLETTLDNKMHEGLLQYKNSLKQCVKVSIQTHSELEKRYVSVGNFLKEADLKIATIGRYFDHNKDGLTCELSLLQELSKIDLTFPDEAYIWNMGKSVGVQVETVKIESSNQTEHTEKGYKSVQTENKTSDRTSEFVREPSRQLIGSCRVKLPVSSTGHPQDVPKFLSQSECLMIWKTAIIEFPMKVQRREPLSIPTSKNVRLGDFEIQIIAYSLNHGFALPRKGWWNQEEPQLYLKVKRTWLPNVKPSPLCDQDRTKIELINRVNLNRTICSDWYYLNEETEQSFLPNASFLDPKTSWVNSDNSFYLRTRTQYTEDTPGAIPNASEAV